MPVEPSFKSDHVIPATKRPPGKSHRRVTILAFFAVLFLSFLCWRLTRSTTSIEDAEKLLRNGEYEKAEIAGLRISQNAASKAAGLSVAYRSALQAKRFEDALTHFECLPDDSRQFRSFAAAASDMALNSLHLFQRAELLLQRASAVEPENLDIIERRAFLLGLTGRSQKAEPLRLNLVRHGVRTWTMLWLICLGDDALENSEMLESVSEDTTDPLALFALARLVSERGHPEQAREMLQRAIAIDAPVEAVVAAGKLAREAGDRQELRDLLIRSADVTDSATLWWLRGVWCEDHGRLKEATRCHAEAVMLQPNLSRSLMPLARLMELDGNVRLADTLRERVSNLALYLNAVKAVRQEPQKPQWERVLSLCNTLSLDTEAAGWLTMGRPEWMRDEPVRAIVEWVKTQRTSTHHGRVAPESHPLFNVDLSKWPMPDFAIHGSENPSVLTQQQNTPTKEPAAPDSARTPIHWSDVASDTGLNFVFEPVPGSTTAGPRMFEFTGGGVAVWDYDCDGFLDTFWTQGIHWPAGQSLPPKPTTADPTDQLFRNLSGRHWQNSTTYAGIRETGFGQGVAAGDLNEDGFPDLIVTNAGDAFVHWNHGDGTFTAEQLPVPTGWSTSVAIADLNTDSLPDIFVVRYLGGPEIFTRTCPDSDKHPHSCLPQHFPAEPDLFLRSQGDGQFINETIVNGFDDKDGKGLGVAVADFSGDGRLDVFVANDTTPNACWIAQSPESVPRFADLGLANGLALNADGRAQADMGIALDDADGNGLLDLFITKFFNETNTLYLQIEPGLFADSTSGTGLGDTSLRLLGFGARFVDADLDGWSDIVITNGHIDDVRHRGEPFEMPPQFYRNTGNLTFEELNSEELGPFFSREVLGRGMAKGDWNHDGREDIFISHIGSPAAVLENTSPPQIGTEGALNWVSLELVGIRGTRDPVGAKIELTANGRKHSKFVAAGHGYLASDSRRIMFGIGSASRIETIQITWPNGTMEVIGDVPADQRYVIIEGRPQAVPQP